VTIIRRAVAEFIGTAFLLAAIVGSGIMGERLSAGNAGIALLANSIATGAALVALILTFAPISGAHFNPAVTLAAAFQRRLPWRDVPAYVVMQIIGAFAGAASANLMFGLPAFFPSAHARGGWPLLFSECIATFGLITVIALGVDYRESTVPYAVAAYITSAYWFTSSTSFANPAVTMARAVTDTFSGIRPGDVPAFIVAQMIGVAIAVPVWNWFRRPSGATEETKSLKKAAK
jgi:glycerol uptake facilitator-like aquaporin